MKKLRIAAYILLFIVVFLSSAIITMNYYGSLPQRLMEVDWSEDSGTIYADLLYPNQNGHKYDLYIPSDLIESQPQQLILFIHGGSFNSGTKEDGDYFCKYYADKGYITATLDYTLQTQGLDASLHIMNGEVKSCVDAICEKCIELGFNLNGMAVCGVSAGGTLAMNYALMSSDESSVPVRFVFQLAGPADFEISEWGLLKKVDNIKTDAEFVSMMVGYSVTDDMIASGTYREYLNAVSPAYLITEETIPFLVGYGLKDHCVPQNSKYRLLDALRENNIPHDYIEFPNSNHGMYSDLDCLQMFLDKSLEYAEKYFTDIN